MALPLSVITICRDRAGELPRTLDSLAAVRALVPIQWVVVDGASGDGSAELLRAALRPGDRMVSERDRGIADAFNKGLGMADGAAVLFMNAGDEFAAPTALAAALAGWERARARWLVAAGEVVDAGGRTLFVRRPPLPLRDPWSLVRTNCQILHQAVIADRALFAELGGFDERWRIGMDYELWLRWLRAGHVPQASAEILCRFHRGGASGDPVRNVAEERAIRRRHGVALPAVAEGALHAAAWTKRVLRGRYGRWLYRLKERLGVRI